MRLQSEAQERIDKNSLSNGTLLWWSAALLDGFLSLVCHELLGFLFWNKGEDVK
jgi:hypothetical protein